MACFDQEMSCLVLLSVVSLCWSSLVQFLFCWLFLLTFALDLRLPLNAGFLLDAAQCQGYCLKQQQAARLALGLGCLAHYKNSIVYVYILFSRYYLVLSNLMCVLFTFYRSLLLAVTLVSKFKTSGFLRSSHSLL